MHYKRLFIQCDFRRQLCTIVYVSFIYSTFTKWYKRTKFGFFIVGHTTKTTICRFLYQSRPGEHLELVRTSGWSHRRSTERPVSYSFWYVTAPIRAHLTATKFKPRPLDGRTQPASPPSWSYALGSVFARRAMNFDTEKFIFDIQQRKAVWQCEEACF